MVKYLILKIQFTVKQLLYKYNYVHSIKVILIYVLDFCDEPKRLLRLIILGVFTFGISILVWYIYVKYKDNDEGTYVHCTV